MKSTSIFASIAFVFSITSAGLAGCTADDADEGSAEMTEDGVHARGVGNVVSIRATRPSGTVVIGAPGKLKAVLASLGVDAEAPPLREGQPRCVAPAPTQTFELLDAEGRTLAAAKLTCASPGSRAAGTITMRGKSYILDADVGALDATLSKASAVGDVLYGITSVREETPEKTTTVKQAARVKSLLDAVGLDQEARAPGLLPTCVPNERIVFLRGTTEVARLGVYCSLQTSSPATARLDPTDGAFGTISVDASKMNIIFARETPLAQPNR